MICQDDGAETSFKLGFSPTGHVSGSRWALYPDGITAVLQLGATTSGAHTPGVDWSQAGLFLITFGNNSTFAFSNAIPGQTIEIIITQDGTGSRTGTFPTGCVFAGGSKTLSTAANAIDSVLITCTGPGVYLCNLLKAYS